ncbi:MULTISPECIES: oxygenase MpaB family protein [unclassified Beijerinckia]|uniref:oxygenase MpaB family protein n=1 Tax=unclassified Beijerinckia TaxID=2638183 RepID=UPI00089A53F6|nr:MULTISPECIES: oxygenase MpaB family protein [unclassified Beijerinckia]MDH7798033.1 hypothetical protein [Beijerinckia sp. GAS462]SED06632.1 hypothetical protein SAMN05443249_4325 [Beijerinckia sp. 28-YEA-48]
MESVRDNGWPGARGRRSSIATQFGSDRADLLAWALTTGDPQADAVVEALAQDGAQNGARDDLNRGLVYGLASLHNPHAAVAAFLGHLERTPDYVDDDLLDRGSRPFHSMPPAVHIVSLSVGALIRVYESPSITAVLADTGRLIDGAAGRIRETAKWLGTVMLPGALRVGGAGYVATAQVRLLHARVRHAVRRRGFDEAAFGVPVNQVDLGRTWMDFTLTAWSAEAAMGFGLTTVELERLYRIWWHVGHLLGIDARLIEGVSNHEQARRIDDLFQAVTGPLTKDSVALADATLHSIQAELRAALSLPETLGIRALWSLARRFHGDRIADELQIPRSPVADPLIAGAIEIVRSRRAHARKDAVQWEAGIDGNIDELSKQLAAFLSKAEYEDVAPTYQTSRR